MEMNSFYMIFLYPEVGVTKFVYGGNARTVGIAIKSRPDISQC
jgi:hypothetical protein